MRPWHPGSLYELAASTDGDSLASVDRKQVNQYRWRVFGDDPHRLIAFVCECGLGRCRRTVVLTSHQYLEHRPARLVHDDHHEHGAGTERPGALHV